MVGDRPAPSGAGWRWLLVAVGAVATVAALAGLGARATYGARTSGDEPQYLLSAASLFDDGDLDISDELAARAYRPWHEITVSEQTLPLDDAGRRVSPHDPLLPVVLAVPLGLGGWVAAKAVLALLAGLTASVTLWLSVRRFAVRPALAAVVVAGAFASLPLAPYGTQVYPELPAALVVTATVAALTGPRRPALSAVGAVVGVVALPWLSVKYGPVAVVLALGLLARLRRDRRTAAAMVAVAVLAAAGVAYLLAHRWIYGGWTAYAAGDHFADTGELSVVGTSVDPLGRARRLTGLVVDRHFGIGPWAPVWFGLPVAVGALLRRRPPGAVLLLATLTAGWANATFVALTMHGWWVPGRQIVIVLPLAAVALAWLVQHRPVLLPVAATAGIIGAVNWAWLAIEASRGRRALIVDFAATTAPAYRLVRPLFGDGMRAAPVDLALHLGWSAAVVALVAVGWRLGRRPALGPPAPVGPQAVAVGPATPRAS